MDYCFDPIIKTASIWAQSIVFGVMPSSNSSIINVYLDSVSGCSEQQAGEQHQIM